MIKNILGKFDELRSTLENQLKNEKTINQHNEEESLEYYKHLLVIN